MSNDAVRRQLASGFSRGGPRSLLLVRRTGVGGLGKEGPVVSHDWSGRSLTLVRTGEGGVCRKSGLEWEEPAVSQDW